MAEKFTVTGEQDLSIDKQMSEIKRQIRQKGGSPLNPELVATTLQNIVEGKFQNNSGEEKLKKFIEIKTLVSDGRDGKNFLFDLENSKFSVLEYTKFVIESEEFNSTVTVGTKYRIAIMKGEEFTLDERMNKNIRKEIAKLGGIMPPAELAPLFRMSFSDEEIMALGLLWVIVMHEPINDSKAYPRLLSLAADGFGKKLGAFIGLETDKYHIKCGFIFLLPISSDSVDV